MWESQGSHTRIQVRGCEPPAWRLKPNSRAVRSLPSCAASGCFVEQSLQGGSATRALRKIKQVGILLGNAAACC